MKLIRECRMGRPKTFKTGAVVGTYPKPMLVFLFDAEDIAVLPSKTAKGPFPPNFITLPTYHEDVVFAKPGTMAGLLAAETQPLVTVLDYSSVSPIELDLMYSPTKSQLALERFQGPGVGDYNLLARYLQGSKPLPWKTIVFSTITGYMDVVLNHMASFNPGSMGDARKWAGDAGGKVRQLILSAINLPCHVVFIAHTQAPEVDDTTKMVQELPNVLGKLRSVIGGLFSQYFYSDKDSSGKPIVRCSDYMYVKGLGTRWPAMTGECQPDFNSIYGKEGLSL